VITTFLGSLAVTAAASLLAIGPATANNYASKSPSADMDIVATAVSAGSFETLVKAVQTAGLVDTLKGDGPVTVFAPTDAAFARIPADQLNALLADKAKLTEVLTYHVVAGNVSSARLASMKSAKPVGRGSANHHRHHIGREGRRGHRGQGRHHDQHWRHPHHRLRHHAQLIGSDARSTHLLRASLSPGQPRNRYLPPPDVCATSAACPATRLPHDTNRQEIQPWTPGSFCRPRPTLRRESQP